MDEHHAAGPHANADICNSSLKQMQSNGLGGVSYMCVVDNLHTSCAVNNNHQRYQFKQNVLKFIQSKIKLFKKNKTCTWLLCAVVYSIFNMRSSRQE